MGGDYADGDGAGAGSGGDGGGGGGALSPLSIFLLAVVLQLLDGFVELLKKRGSRSSERLKLQREIKQLLKEANSLSTPSTFAQAAKLRRLAAAKEKELAKKQEEDNKEKKWSYDLCSRTLMISKPPTDADLRFPRLAVLGCSCSSSSSTSTATARYQ